MLTANRPELARRAVECFRKQTYTGKSKLVVWDTSSTEDTFKLLTEDIRDGEYYLHDAQRLVIGQLRNRANSYATSREGFEVPDILIHWDDDDYSHPNRIAEQVALLQSSGADIVGYREMLFWREPKTYRSLFRRMDGSTQLEYNEPGEAWLYQNADTKYALGTSLCYWRRIWERRGFDATSSGEDDRFCKGRKVFGVTSVFDTSGPPPDGCGIAGAWARGAAPRMIARIHGSNTSGAYRRDSMEREARRSVAPHWKRVPEWDKYCDGIFRSA